MENYKLLFSNKDVFKIWFRANILIGLVALIWCIIETNSSLNEVGYLSFTGGLVGLVFSIPSLIGLLIANYFFNLYFFNFNQYYLFNILILIINILYFVNLYCTGFLQKNEGFYLIITSVAGIISLYFVYLKKLKINNDIK